MYCFLFFIFIISLNVKNSFRRFLIETFVIKDSILFDDGKQNPTTNYWYNQQNTSATRDTDCCTLTENGGNLIYRLLGTYAQPTNTVIEFDIYQVDGVNTNSICGFGTSTASFSTYFNLNNANASIGEWVHIKLEYKDGYVTINDDYANKKAFNPSTTNFLFGFFTVGDCTTVKFKNFCVYPV